MAGVAACTAVRSVPVGTATRAAGPVVSRSGIKEPSAPAAFATLDASALALVAPRSLTALGIRVVAGVRLLVDPGRNPYQPHHLYQAGPLGRYLAFASDYGVTVPAGAVESEASNYGTWGLIRLADGRVRTYPDPTPGAMSLVLGADGWLVFREEFLEPAQACRSVSEPDGCRSWELLARSMTTGVITTIAKSTSPQDFVDAPNPVSSGPVLTWTAIDRSGRARVYVCTLPQCRARSYPVANALGFDFLPGNGLLWAQSPLRQTDSMVRVDLSTGRSVQWLAPHGDTNLTPGPRLIAFTRSVGPGGKAEVLVAPPAPSGLGPAVRVAAADAVYGLLWLSPSTLVVMTDVGYDFVNIDRTPAKSVDWTADFDYGTAGQVDGHQITLAVRQVDGTEDLLVLQADS